MRLILIVILGVALALPSVPARPDLDPKDLTAPPVIVGWGLVHGSASGWISCYSTGTAVAVVSPRGDTYEVDYAIDTACAHDAGFCSGTRSADGRIRGSCGPRESFELWNLSWKPVSYCNVDPCPHADPAGFELVVRGETVDRQRYTVGGTLSAVRAYSTEPCLDPPCPWY